MPEAIDASSIATNYYKLAHLCSVTYLIYTTNNATNDLTLLELELLVRHSHPKCLVTYYNKYLYCFQFNHIDEQLDLTVEYPQLQLKYSNQVSANMLSNPPKVASEKDNNSGNEYLAYACLSFLKAVKKLVLFNLSRNGAVQLFGNYAVIKEQGSSNSILHLDPILLPNGDLLISVSEKCHLQLFDSSIVNINEIESVDLNFVLYIIPSGIRCHLYDNVNIASNFTTDPPKNSEVLMKLIEYSTGVDRGLLSPLIWVKLVPNLQHLNNQTSKISKFIHSVDNKKFILWPWRLCLLQFGLNEKEDTVSSSGITCDPLNLISDFIDFNISHHHQANVAGQLNPSHQHNQSFNYSIPSALSTGMSSSGPNENKGDLNIVGDIPGSVLDIFGIQSSDTNDFFNGANFQGSQGQNDIKSDTQESVKKNSDEEDMEMEDLFGDASEDEKGTTEASANELNEEKLFENLFNDELNQEKQANELDTISKSIEDDVLKEESVRLEDLKEYKDSKLQPSAIIPNTFIDIPKDQMTIPSLKNLKQTPQIYNDPGAPMPIVPTPIFPQSGANYTAPGSVQSVNPPTSAAATDNEGNEASRSIFSPILFNPIIKSNIDTKYGKGGKFYVDKEVSAGPDIDSKRKTLRATSVSGFELPQRREDFIGIESIVEDNNRRQASEFPEEQDNEGMKDESRDNHMNEKDNIIKNLEGFDEDEEEDDDENEDEDEDEESDEDDDMNLDYIDMNMKRSPPLKLNTLNDPYVAQLNPAGVNFNESNFNAKQMLANSYNVSSMNTGGFSSPTSFGINTSKTNVPPKNDSPFGLNNFIKDDHNGTTSPTGVNSEQLNPKQEQSDNSPMVVDMDIEKKSTSKDAENTPSGVTTPNARGSIPESSNCLPLILRGINVSSIPSSFILNNIFVSNKISTISTSFDMDMEDENEWSDYELCKNSEMTVKLNNLDEFLKWLGPNLIFDMGLNKYQKFLEMKISNHEKNEENYDNIEGKAPSRKFENKLCDIFPFCYKVNLNEFTIEPNVNELKGETNTIQDELDNQLSFLDDITNEDILNPRTQLKKLNSIEWDTIYSETSANKENWKKYQEIVHNVGQSSLVNTLEDGTIFTLANDKARVLKHNDTILNLNSIGIKFWKYLNFSPLNGPKNFQLLLISEHDHNMLHHNYNIEFLNFLVYNYKECCFGTISKINLQPSDSRPNVEGIDNGLLLVHKEEGDNAYGNIYKQINRKLNALVEMIKSDLINKTNKFEFDRPLLLLFINFDESVNSLLQISKLIRNFKLFLSHHQLPLVEVFAHIIPWSLIIKQSGNQRRLKYLSNFKLSKLSMNLYNQCPNERTIGKPVKEPTKHLFTQLVKEPPSNLNFKFMNNVSNGNGKTSFNDDIFLHLAYERSIDKNWFSAAWSDPLGIVVLTKSWHCSPLLQKTNNKNVHSLESISDEIWNTSTALFKKLNDEVIKRTSGLGGKKFLVLTRINSIIPDDELIHWKRLSIKHKDISLIVLSVNKAPKLLFSGPTGAGEQEDKWNNNSNTNININDASTNLDNNLTTNSTNQAGNNDFFKAFGSSNPSPNNNGGSMSISPSNNVGINFHSPQQFLNAPGNFLSPQDFVTSTGGATNSNTNPASNGSQDNPDAIIHDPTEELTAVIPKAPLPSFNSPTRLGMKIGYLIKDTGLSTDEQIKQYLVYEVNLLSCSNYWNLNAIMKILLNQYKKLITLNDILCVNEIDGTIANNSAKKDPNTTPDTTLPLNQAASGLIPWHIAAVTKSLDYLIHIDVEE